MTRSLAAHDPNSETLVRSISRALHPGVERGGPRIVHMVGCGDLFGSPAAYESSFDRHGRFLRTMRGRLGERMGFDGERAWHAYEPGRLLTLRLEDREVSLLSNWLASGFWLDDACPIEIGATGPASLDLRLVGGVRTAQLALDTATMRPVRLEVPWALGMQSFAIEDWFECDGVLFPRRLVHAQGPVAASVFEIESWRTSDAFPGATQFAMPRGDSPDVRFLATAPARLESRRTKTGHLLVRLRIGGRDAGWFIFDSGASVSMITPRTAEAFGLPSFGRTVSGGAGSVHSEDALCEVHDLEVGPLSVERVVAVLRDFSSFEPALGAEIAGILGYDVFSRAIVRVSMAEPVLEIFNPHAFTLERGTWQELVIHGRHPHVRARYEGEREGLFRLDTGGGHATVLFHAPAVARERLLEGRVTSAVKIGGASGLASALMGELAWFEMAGRRSEKLRVIFADPGSGALDDPYSDGTLGGGLLSQFEITFDYPNERIALLPIS